jgi:hypothetical protein
MLGRWMCLGALVVVVGACGQKKEPQDPSDKPVSSDETPKWEGATNPRPEDAKPASKGGTAPQEAPKQRTDQYDKEATEVVLKRAARVVKGNCGQAKDDNGKAIGPWGKLTIQVQLGHNGWSKGTTVPSPYQGTPGGTCIEKAFTKLQFPPWAGADAQVDWEVELVEPGKEGKSG